MNPFEDRQFNDQELLFSSYKKCCSSGRAIFGVVVMFLVQTFTLLYFTIPMASYMNEIEKSFSDDPDDVDTLDDMFYGISIFGMIQIGLCFVILVKLYYYGYHPIFKTATMNFGIEFLAYGIFSIIIFGLHAKVLDITRNYKSSNYPIPDLSNDLLLFKITFAFGGLVPIVGIGIIGICFG